MPEETADGVPLVVREVAVIVLYVLKLRYVAEQAVCVYKILVHVLEVRQHDVSPENELVQGLCLGVMGGVNRVKSCQKPQTVTYLAAIKTAEEIVYGVHGRYGHGCTVPAFPHQV